jgi:hypothetical protein
VSGILPDTRWTRPSREWWLCRLAASLAPRQDAGEDGLEARAPPRQSFLHRRNTPRFDTLQCVSQESAWLH